MKIYIYRERGIKRTTTDAITSLIISREHKIRLVSVLLYQLQNPGYEWKKDRIGSCDWLFITSALAK